MKTKSANANSGSHDFPRRNGPSEQTAEGGRGMGEILRLKRARRVAVSLIIGLNVASADSDESSGFECSL